jgi:hypothetical protein
VERLNTKSSLWLERSWIEGEPSDLVGDGEYSALQLRIKEVL